MLYIPKQECFNKRQLFYFRSNNSNDYRKKEKNLLILIWPSSENFNTILTKQMNVQTWLNLLFPKCDQSQMLSNSCIVKQITNFLNRLIIYLITYIIFHLEFIEIKILIQTIFVFHAKLWLFYDLIYDFQRLLKSGLFKYVLIVSLSSLILTSGWKIIWWWIRARFYDFFYNDCKTFIVIHLRKVKSFKG